MRRNSARERTKKRGFAIPATPIVLASNVLLVFIVVAAFLSLDSYEKSLLGSLEHALSQQARVIAAWLGESNLDEEGARRAVSAMRREHTARIRVVDAAGLLLADSSADLTVEPVDSTGEPVDPTVGPASAIPAPEVENAPQDEEASPESSLIYRALSAPVRLAKRWFLPPQPPIDAADDLIDANGRLTGFEVRSALSGSYGSATRISAGGQVSVTLYSAVPVRRPGASGVVQGAVILSQSTFRILQSLYALRVQVGGVFIAGLLAAVALSLALSLFFTGPLRSLARQARAATARGAPGRGHFSPPGPGVEANELYEALEEYSARLGERIGWAERFAQDAAHELRNPIASVRAAAEYLLDRGNGDLSAEEARERLESVMADAMRMDRILRGLRRLSRLDVESSEHESARAAPLVKNLAERMASGRTDAIRIDFKPGTEDALIDIESERFILALETVIDNALSFTPPGKAIFLQCEILDNSFYIKVLDDGPGIPQEHIDRIFDRFFSYRPDEISRDEHSGLGLSIAKAVMDTAGGSISAANREEGGAIFTLRFPLASKRAARSRKEGKNKPNS